MLTRWSGLYTNQTKAEKAIEPAVASLGVRYRTQHPLWGLRLFPDFVLLDHKLVLEIDDTSHNTKAKKKADLLRTEKLNKAGWIVVRCTNDEALSDPRAALRKMLVEAKLEHLMKE
jgi:very-short-patch-repair endonuclease